MQSLPWIVALLAPTLLCVVLATWAIRASRPRKLAPLPTEWALSARPVFSIDERRVYRLLRDALPHHIVLSKLPLVRFCQPNDPAQVRFWYDLLGANHVTFAICSANGRVLAAIDLDTDRGNSRRVLQIKQSVLGACRVRYLRCPVDNLPTVAELQLLVPSSNAPARGPQPATAPLRDLHGARNALANTVATRRAERSALWQDSTLFQDSFFAPDSRPDGFSGSDFSGLTGSPPARIGPASHTSSPVAYRSTDAAADDVGGIVVDSSKPLASPRH